MVRVIAVLLVVAAAFVGCVLKEASAAKQTSGISLDHIVGGRLGWSLPPNTSYYQDWARNRTFVVGDTLVFMYTSALQNIMQVSKEDFQACTDKKIINWYYVGPTLIKLDKPGPLYFYCGVGTHCESGQKLAINVAATAGPDPVRDGLAPPHAPAVGTTASSSSAHRVAIAGLVPSLLLMISMSM